MISWIQRYFHKHFRLVFAGILLAMGLPMVVIYSSSGSGIGQAGSKRIERPFFNVNLGNEEQARRVFTDGNLSAQLKAGYNALEGAQLQQYALQRVAGLAVADELHLPAPTADQVAKYIPTLRYVQDPNGAFDQKRYTAFADSLKAGATITTADVNRVLRDDVRLDQLAKIIGGPGYVMPNDIKQQLIRADSSWTVQVASLDYATFAPTIPVTEEILKKYHEENAFRYDVPARPRLSYVEFKGEEFTPPGAPSEADLRAFYKANEASFPLPADAEKKDAAPVIAGAATDNFPKVRAQVEVAIRNAASARGAAKAANDLTVALFEKKLAANSPELAAFLAANRRTAVPVAPFAPDTTPADLPWLGSYADQIARLSQERYFTDPLPTTNSFVVLLWNDSLPAYKPLFSEVHDRVAADYKENEKRKRFIEQGRTLRMTLQAAAAGGAEKFASAAAAEKLTVKSYANFTLRKPPQDLPYPALSALQGLEAGQVSEMMATGEQGQLVYVQDRKLPDLTPGSPRYAELQSQLMLFTAGTNENSYLGGLVERELKKIEPAKP
ncbi:MAG: peptidyl-prolyl cis-trans isomerase [bacterium]|nr:peptidyl-prolyl cis-trans isomerase [bacterium]